MTALRHQLAAYSPISLAGCSQAAIAAVRLSADPRPRLVSVLRDIYAADAVLLTGSGTQALQTAITLAAEGDDRPVALPAYTCYDVVSAAVGANVPVVFYDIDPDTLGPDFASLERALIAGARAVVITVAYGIPVDWGRIESMAGRFGATLIEDAAQGHGASWQGRKLGTLADISVVSFGRGKGWTGGNGGAVLLRRDSVARVRDLAPPGSFADLKAAATLGAQWIFGRPSVYGIPRAIPSLNLGVTVYHAPSRPCLMTRPAAAAILVEMRPSDVEATHRRSIAELYTKSLKGESGVAIAMAPEESIAGYLRYPVRVLGGVPAVARESDGSIELLDRLRRLGIERGYPMSIARLEVISRLIVGAPQNWPGAERLVRELVTLPTHSKISVDERRKILKLWAVGGPFAAVF